MIFGVLFILHDHILIRQKSYLRDQHGMGSIFEPLSSQYFDFGALVVDHIFACFCIRAHPEM